MDSFIQGYGGEGRLDSSGAFTLDGERATLQMLELEGAEREGWLLRLLQAAVASQANLVQISNFREHTLFRCAGYKSERLPTEEVLAALRGSHSDDHHPAVAYLARAVRALAHAQNYLKVEVNGLHLQVDGQGARVTSGPPTGNWELRLQNRPKTDWATWLLQKLCGHNLLPGRARFIPIAVSGPGRYSEKVCVAQARLGTVHPGSPDFVAVELLLRGRNSLGHDVLSDRAMTPFPRVFRTGWAPRSCDVLMQHTLYLDSRTLKLMGHSSSWGEGSRNLLGRLRLPLRLQGPSKLILVRDGVTCNTCELELGWPGLEVVLTAPSLKLDLSQWSPVVSADLRRLIKKLTPLLETALKQEEDCLRRLPPNYQEALQRNFRWLNLRPLAPAQSREGSRTLIREVAPPPRPQDEARPKQPKRQRRPFRR